MNEFHPLKLIARYSWINLALKSKKLVMEFIKTEKLPQPIGPFSQAVKVGNLIFCSGNVANDPETNQLLDGGIEAQTRQTLKNISTLLNSQELQLSDVAKTTVFMVDLNDFNRMNNIYSEIFKDHKPARTTVQVSKLLLVALIEIGCIVYQN